MNTFKFNIFIILGCFLSGCAFDSAYEEDTIYSEYEDDYESVGFNGQSNNDENCYGAASIKTVFIDGVEYVVMEPVICQRSPSFYPDFKPDLVDDKVDNRIKDPIKESIITSAVK